MSRSPGSADADDRPDGCRPFWAKSHQEAKFPALGGNSVAAERYPCEAVRLSLFWLQNEEHQMFRNLARVLLATTTLTLVGTASAQTISPRMFVSKTLQSNTYEVEAGRLAQAKGHSQAIKLFGQRMVHEHTQMSEKLRGAIRGKNFALSGEALSSEQRRMLDALRRSGENFDQTYAKQQVHAHTQALSLTRSYANQGDLPYLQSLAESSAPMIRAHLEAARRLSAVQVK
jgi:putative membrane protein